jgi:hypothetical protein
LKENGGVWATSVSQPRASDERSNRPTKNGGETGGETGDSNWGRIVAYFAKILHQNYKDNPSYLPRVTRQARWDFGPY